MLETSYGLIFFLKSPKRKTDVVRSVYLRITINGVPKETSTKRKWDVTRWDQVTGRAIGTKEDAKSLNYYLDSLVTQINNFRTQLINQGKPLYSSDLIGYIRGTYMNIPTLLEEFHKHNEEVRSLIGKEYAKATHTRFVTSRSHVAQFIQYKYKRDDVEFRELNYEFITDYEFFLKTVRLCLNNTALKYISALRKIVKIAVAKDYLPKDPFGLFKGKKIKTLKRPLSWEELKKLEIKEFTTERLTVVRDIFVFQCYTGLAYIDAYQLKRDDIKSGPDGRLWIMSSRQKSKSITDIPLLPKALEIMEKYKDDPTCIARGSVLPGRSNQKMNAYLDEIAELCCITSSLNTHKARRTFASTVTLNMGVPIHVVKEMLGHYSVKQTEEYAITAKDTISKEMNELTLKLGEGEKKMETDPSVLLENLENELGKLKKELSSNDISNAIEEIARLDTKFKEYKDLFRDRMQTMA